MCFAGPRDLSLQTVHTLFLGKSAVMSGTAGRAKEHAPGEWERIKRPFCDLYHKQKKTLPEVRQTLKDEQNFDATYVRLFSTAHGHHKVFQPYPR